jgi:hypothetical protein
MYDTIIDIKKVCSIFFDKNECSYTKKCVLMLINVTSQYSILSFLLVSQFNSSWLIIPYSCLLVFGWAHFYQLHHRWSTFIRTHHNVFYGIYLQVYPYTYFFFFFSTNHIRTYIESCKHSPIYMKSVAN